MTPCIAVIDLGKTNLKLAAVSLDHRVIGRWTAPNRPGRDGPYPHLDLDGVIDWLVEALTGLVAAHEVLAIVPCGYGSTAGLVDGSSLVLPVMDYEAEPPAGIAEAYAGIAPPFREVYAPTNPAGLTLARQMFWQAQAFPEPFARAQHLLTLPQLLTWRLTGRMVGEVTSLGAQTHLWAVTAGGPSSLAVARGWDRLIPPMQPAWSIAGTLLPSVAARAGLPPSTPVLVGIHDSNANYLRYRWGLPEGGDFTLMSTGTWLISFDPACPLDRLEPARDTNTNTDADGHPVACARFMVSRETALAAGGADPGAVTPQDLHWAVTGGAMALPAFTDSGGPVPCVDGRGRRIGAAPGTEGQRAAIGVLYAALMSSRSLDTLDCRGGIVLDGGFIRTPHYAALLAALRPGQSVRVSDEPEGTALGAALLWHRQTDLPIPRPNLTDVGPVDLPGLDAYAARWRSLIEG